MAIPGDGYPIYKHAGIVLFRHDTFGRRAAIAFVRERLDKVLEMDQTLLTG